MKGFFSKIGRGIATCCAAAVALLAGSVAKADTVTLPNTGVDVSGYATAAITALGAIVAVVIGGVVAFMLVRAGVKWVRGLK